MAWIIATIVCIVAVLASVLLMTSTNNQACTNDAPLKIDGIVEGEIDPCFCFSEGYSQARSKFRNAALAAGAEYHSLNIVDQYTTDIAVFEGKLPGYVVHTSGVHGVEGYAGSAIQIAWLKYFASSALFKQGRFPTIILVHAVNPFGMAHYRRWNENNVDLNRNALTKEEWEIALKRDANIASYEDFDTVLFNPRRAPTLYDDTIGFWIGAIKSISKHGLGAMKRALVTGQYHFPAGVFYGGSELQPSHRMLQKFAKTMIQSDDENDGNAAPMVTWIDVHTGLGKSGVDTLLVNSDMPMDQAKTWFPNVDIQGLDQEDNEVSGGFDLSMGIMTNNYQGLFPGAWIINQEFGTLHSTMVARAMVLENMAYQHLPQEETGKWTAMSRDAFYPRNEKWRASILTRGLTLLSQAIARTSNSEE